MRVPSLALFWTTDPVEIVPSFLLALMLEKLLVVILDEKRFLFKLLSDMVFLLDSAMSGRITGAAEMSWH